MATAFHLGVAATSVGLVVGLPGLYLAWAAVRGNQDPAQDPKKVADDLATLVGRQWEDEIALRRLNDPYPLPVSWTATCTELSDDWASLVTLARTGAGWPSMPSDAWADRPEELDGHGDQISAVMAKVPTRRLVVLGEPGSGKTMLVIRLVLDLLADRKEGDPVPVLASLASWDPDFSRCMTGWSTGSPSITLRSDWPGLQHSKESPHLVG